MPIKAMISKSNLESTVGGTATFPLLVNKAALTTDPQERFRLTVVAVLSSFYYTNQFLKPLNPILGETFYAEYPEGTKVYAEQISHHPPISYFLLYGPDDSYTYSGYYDIDVKAGLNSMAIRNKGKRVITYHTATPQTIHFDFPNDLYKGTFFGTTRLESLGTILFHDRTNHIKCEVKLGGVRGKPSDFFLGEMTVEGQSVGSFRGSYLGYIDFDNLRYWQYNTSTKPIRISVQDNHLSSDHMLRPDLIQLRKGDTAEAQKSKDRLESQQRQDAKLRKEGKKKKK